MSKADKLSALAIALMAGVILTGCSPATPLTNLELPEVSQTEVTERPTDDGALSSDAPEVLGPEPTEQPSQEPAEQEAQPTEAESAQTAEPLEQAPSPAAAIPLSEVQANNQRDSCWIVLVGDVYDFTMFVQQHPFGAQISNVVCGNDATEIFQENTDINEVLEQLQPFYLGPSS